MTPIERRASASRKAWRVRKKMASGHMKSAPDTENPVHDAANRLNSHQVRILSRACIGGTLILKDGAVIGRGHFLMRHISRKLWRLGLVTASGLPPRDRLTGDQWTITPTFFGRLVLRQARGEA